MDSQGERPVATDQQRRCWTVSESGQCVIYNGHVGEHQFRVGEPDAMFRYGEALGRRLSDAEAREEGWPQP